MKLFLFSRKASADPGPGEQPVSGGGRSGGGGAPLLEGRAGPFTGRGRGPASPGAAPAEPVNQRRGGHRDSSRETRVSRWLPLKGPAHSKNKNLYILAPAQIKRAQPI